MIPYGRQCITEADISSVVEVLRSDWLTQGPVVPHFEQKVADYCGAKHAVAANSATSALHLACLALGLGPGDILWTSPITFVASANCALYCGADVDFVDIDPITYNLAPKALELKLIAAEKEGCLPKVLVPVHLCGQPCDMPAIRKLADRYGFSIIEDASHAIGASYSNGLNVGSCYYADITIFSFHPVKIITTGEGGMALTNSGELANKMSRLRSHGITREVTEMQSPCEGGWYYQQIDLGFNYRITEMQAALGLSQMQRLQAFIDRRRELASRYDALLSNMPLDLPRVLPSVKSSWHLYIIRLFLDRICLSRREVFDALRQANIGVNLHYIPVYSHPYYRALGFEPGHCPEAECYYREVISLPLYPELAEKEQDYIATTLRNLLA